MQQVNLGLIGGGTVGSAVYRGLLRNGDLMRSRLGVRLEVARIAVQDLRKTRDTGIPSHLLTPDWKSVVHNPDVHVVVELIGGTTTAREVVLAALKHGKPVVTANKALLSKHGEELFAAARANNANLYYEASVAGGIPIIKVLRESLCGNRITCLRGIVNGTCNYILTRMKLEGIDFAAALAEAQRLGFAEADPTLDIDGHDAAHKTGILASLAHGFWVQSGQIHTEGIRQVTQLDIQFAARLGYTIRLLGVVKEMPGPAPRALKSRTGARAATKATKPCPRIQVAVYPALVPDSHVLASVNHAYNAVAVRGDIVGETLFYGRGAGGDPTASSVLGDLADAALDLKHDSHDRVPPFVPHECGGQVVPMDSVPCRYYVRLAVLDRPGVFAKISAILAQARIGISSIIQPEGHEGESVPVILMIHDAPDAVVKGAVARIARLAAVKAPPVMIRVECTAD